MKHPAVALLFALVAFSPIQARASVPARQAVAFELSDQHDKLHRFHFPRERVSVLVVSDQRGSSQVEGWVAPIYARFEKSVDIAGIASLPGIPRPLHGWIRQSFRDKVAYPVMLDWSGAVTRALGAANDTATLYIIGTDGKIRAILVGPASGRAVDAAIGAIEKAMRSR